MTKMLLVLAQAQPAAPSGPSSTFMLIAYGSLMAAMYFFMIAPQRKKAKEHEKMLTTLTSGDEIVTTGGLYGTITSVKDDRFVVRIGDNVKVEVGKGFVSTVVKKSGA
ncbi:MAG: preprotein translocase subunit YajC [Opitutae bacterium]|nr:preprotein translocase subunit YajC [Opitutae bacterium]